LFGGALLHWELSPRRIRRPRIAAHTPARAREACQSSRQCCPVSQPFRREGAVSTRPRARVVGSSARASHFVSPAAAFRSVGFWYLVEHRPAVAPPSTWVPPITPKR
jgi:hypothetical protein